MEKAGKEYKVFLVEQDQEYISEFDKEVRVCQYLTAMPPKEEPEEKLHLAIERAKMQLEQ